MLNGYSTYTYSSKPVHVAKTTLVRKKATVLFLFVLSASLGQVSQPTAGQLTDGLLMGCLP